MPLLCCTPQCSTSAACWCLRWPWLHAGRVDGFCLDDGADMEPLTPTVPLFIVPGHPGHMARLTGLFKGLREAIAVLGSDIDRPSPSACLQLDGSPLPYILAGWAMLYVLSEMAACKQCSRSCSASLWAGNSVHPTLMLTWGLMA